MEDQLFAAQRKEFIDHTQLFHEKLTRMYLSSMEGESFDAKLHILWDQWDVVQRCSFLQQAWNQVKQSQVGKQEIILAETCPEIRDPKVLGTDTESISEFLMAIVDQRENSGSYKWNSIVKESVSGLLEKMNWNLWMDFGNSKNKKNYTQILINDQRSLYLNQFATYLIANFCGEFVGKKPLPPAVKCAHCAQPMIEKKRCARCKKVFYCSKACQANNWPSHRGVCKPE